MAWLRWPGTNDAAMKAVVFPATELEGSDIDCYETNSAYSTYRLARRLGSHAIVEYRRPVVQRFPRAPLLPLRRRLADLRQESAVGRARHDEPE